jgi:hypothetical protein
MVAIAIVGLVLGIIAVRSGSRRETLRQQLQQRAWDRLVKAQDAYVHALRVRDLMGGSSSMAFLLSQRLREAQISAGSGDLPAAEAHEVRIGLAIQTEPAPLVPIREDTKTTDNDDGFEQTTIQAARLREAERELTRGMAVCDVLSAERRMSMPGDWTEFDAQRKAVLDQRVISNCEGAYEATKALAWLGTGWFFPRTVHQRAWVAERAHHASVRWMRRLLESAHQSPETRRQIVLDHLDRMKQIKLVAPSRSSEYFVVEAEYWSALEEAGESIEAYLEDRIMIAATMPIGLRDIAARRLEAAKAASNEVSLLSFAPLEHTYIASIRLLNAELALSADVSRRIAALQSHVRRMELIEAAENRTQLEHINQDVEAQFFTAEAKFWLARELAK